MLNGTNLHIFCIPKLKKINREVSMFKRREKFGKKLKQIIEGCENNGAMVKSTIAGGSDKNKVCSTYKLVQNLVSLVSTVEGTEKSFR